MRLRSRLTLLLGLLCASAPALFQQDRPTAADPGRDNDVRAIYSWLITSSTGQDKLYLIAPETIYQSEYPREGCLHVPPDHAADFRQIRADFDRSKNALRFAPGTALYFTTRTVPTFFPTTKPYVILDPNVAKEIMLHSASLSGSPIVRERYPGAEHLLIFSDVFFNQKRTLALVNFDSWCGGLCGISRWIAFEKRKDGVWQMRPLGAVCCDRLSAVHPWGIIEPNGINLTALYLRLRVRGWLTSEMARTFALLGDRNVEHRVNHFVPSRSVEIRSSDNFAK